MSTLGYPASSSQRRFWFLHELDPDPATCNVILCLRLTGPTDAERLEEALHGIVERHEPLRSAFSLRDGELIATPCPVQGWRLEAVPAADDDLDAARLARELAGRPFDLGEPPLVRAQLTAARADVRYLLASIHHIAWDGWSYGVFLRELGQRYDGLDPFANGPGARYSDFVAASLSAASQQTDQLAARARALSDGLELPELATGPGHSAERTVPLHRHDDVLGTKLKSDVEAYARDRGVTPFVVLLASLHAVVCRLGSGPRTCFGIPVADRSKPEFEKLIGCFINTLLVESHLREDATFDQLVLDHRLLVLDALQSRQIPYELIAREVAPQRNLALDPLHQALFVFQNNPRVASELPGIEVEWIDVARERGRIEPTITMWFERPEADLSIEWNGELFVPPEQLVSCWRVLLGGGVGGGGVVSGLCLVSGSERVRVLSGGGGVGVGGRSVVGLVSGFGVSLGGSVAVVDGVGGGCVSFGELTDRVKDVAGRLVSLGVGAGVTVGLCAARGADTVVAVLAVWAAGGAVVAIDPTHPQGRVRSVLGDCGARLVLTDTGRRDWPPDVTVAALDGSGPTGPLGLTATVGPDSAYVIYTSGTTGRPKGVLLNHKAIIARLLNEPIELTAGERCLAKTNLTFIDSLWEMFAPLTKGLPTVICDEHTAHDPNQLIDCLERHQITRLVCVPSLLTAILDTNTDLAARLPHLRITASTGERLTATLAHHYYTQLPHTQLINIYGTSETWDATWTTVPKSTTPNDHIPLGQPLAHTKAHILDTNLNPLPPNITGEIHIAGPGLATGYLNQPQLTTTKFPTHPLNPTQHLYRTGDHGTIDTNGTLHLTGRKDHQINLRGHRIEPQEIEHILLQHPHIKAAAVTLTPNNTLAAYITTTTPNHNTNHIHTHLTNHLPTPLIPTHIIPTQHIPTTPAGKTDRHTLKTQTPPPTTTTTTPPQTPTEHTLLKIWQDVLQQPTITTTDNFFQLGGHSLLAVRLAGAIQEQLDPALELRDLFEAPTIRELAARIDGRSLT